MTTPRRIRAALVSHSAALSGAELMMARVAAACTRVDPVVVLGEHGPLERVLADGGVRTVVVPLAASVRNHAAGVADSSGSRNSSGDDSTGNSRGTSGAVGVAGKALATLRATRVLARTLRAERIDVVVTHSAKAHVWAGLAGRLARVPVVAHVHDVVGAPGSARANTVLLRTALALLPRSVVANSRTTARSLARRPAPTVIGCPVAISERTPPRPDGPFTVGIVGRLTRWKGQDVVVRAFAAARAAGLDPDARLRVVGGALFGDDAVFERELRALVDDLGIAGRVDVRGHRPDAVAEIAACDVLVHASRRPEPFGQVVIEAMALGRPVVAADAGGPAEIVSDGVDGLLVPPGDADALASAIVRLATSREDRDRLADAGRRSVTRFALPRITARIEEVLVAAAR